MKLLLKLNEHKIILSAEQLKIVIDTLQCGEWLTETHVGVDKGSQGYNNSYVPVLKPVIGHELFSVSPVSQDFIDTIKLTMKLDKPEQNF